MMILNVEQAFSVAMSICQNEKKAIAELSDATIKFYLESFDFESSDENVKMIRTA